VAQVPAEPVAEVPAEPVAEVPVAFHPPADQAVPLEEAPAKPRFEVDHRVDPDWDKLADSPAPVQTPSPFLAPSEGADIEYPPVPAPPPDAPVAEVEIGSGLGEPGPFPAEHMAEVTDQDVPEITPVEDAKPVDSMARELGVCDPQDAPPESAVDPTVLEALQREEVPADDEPTDGPPPMPAEPEVRLTRVVEDHALFDDPGLDVARMEAGQEREIVVPVEVTNEDSEPRRFKLSIRLRLDPID
jgi:hypothetical protein